jgi:hypothetical protein
VGFYVGAVILLLLRQGGVHYSHQDRVKSGAGGGVSSNKRQLGTRPGLLVPAFWLG